MKPHGLCDQPATATAKRQKSTKTRLLPSMSYPDIEFCFEGPAMEEGAVAAPSGRFALKLSTNWNEWLLLLDLYFDEKIAIPNPNYAFENCLSLSDDLRAVLVCGPDLIFVQLDPENRKFVELHRSSSDFHIWAAHSLCPSGRWFLKMFDFAAFVLNLDFPVTAVGLEVVEKLQRLPIMYEKLVAAQLVAGRLWLFSDAAFWVGDLSALPDAEAEVEFSELPETKSLGFEIRTATFLDSEHLVGIGKSPYLRMFVLRLRDDKTVDIVATRRLCPENLWTRVDALLSGGGGAEFSVLFVEKSPAAAKGNGWDIDTVGKIGQIRIRRPQSLLLTAHRAALKSQRRFNLPLLEPLAPIGRYNPYRRFNF